MDFPDCSLLLLSISVFLLFSFFLFLHLGRLLDGHAGSAIKVLVAIHYSVLDARNGYIRNVVV